ncbi:uncharacterized protein At4g26450-like [Aristolochia californica]|uniref:uncharacterized protein At4g26450-like n=1 Tax=Aristolochia californica TaxID=171875 RepID=UPI0035D867F3
MHSRHRSPGDSVRSNSVAIGLSSSRISPEGSMRGHGMYTSDYRSFNRGYGRGTPKAYPPPPTPQPPRKGDIFMEAGRLAAEYLVSQGLLSPNSLPNKLQNGHFQDYRGQDRESLPQSDGRASVLSRLGNAVPDMGPSRKRFIDEFSSTGVRGHGRGRRRSGSFKSYGSDWSRENGKNESWPDKSRGFSDAQESDSSYVGGYQAERRGNLNAGSSASRIAAEEFPSKNETPGDSESELDTYESPPDTDSKENSSSRAKEMPFLMDTDSKKGLEDARGLNLEAGEVEDSDCEDKMNEKNEPEIDLVKENVSMELAKQDSSAELGKGTDSTEADLVRRGGRDLLSLCSFGKVPTKARSSLTPRVLKPDENLTRGEKNNIPDTTPARESPTPARESQALAEETFVEGSSSDSLMNQTPNDSKSLTSNLSISSIQPADEPADLETIFVLEREKRARSQSFSDRSSFIHQQELGQGAPVFGRSRSIVITSDQGSFGQSLVTHEGGAKRPREWDSESDEYFHLHNVRAKPSESQVRDLQGDGMTNTVDKKPLVEVALFPEGSCQPNMESKEEKQHLPNSFKICDLNLTESSEMIDGPSDVHPNDAVIGRSISDVQSTLRLQKEVSVDVGLSISHRFNNATGYEGRSSDSKEVVIVDVPDDDEPEKVFDTAARKSETIYSNLENFLSHTENPVDLSNMPDSYGYAISELLGNDISGCSSVSANINDLQTDMTLHNQEVIPGGVDDPIYLSLGEIPISFLGVWDQSNQDYGKSF